MSTKIDQETKELLPKSHPITAIVNSRAVVFQEHRVTGLVIKQTAITQGVPIQLDFVLFRVNPGGHLKQISDSDIETIHDGEEFRAVAPDDNSWDQP